MTIYCITYESGEYSHYQEVFLGGFSSEEKRNEALEKFKNERYTEGYRMGELVYPWREGKYGYYYNEGKHGTEYGLFNLWNFEVDKELE